VSNLSNACNQQFNTYNFRATWDAELYCAHKADAEWQQYVAQQDDSLEPDDISEIQEITDNPSLQLNINKILTHQTDQNTFIVRIISNNGIFERIPGIVRKIVSVQRFFFKIYLTLCALQGNQFKEFEIEEPWKFVHNHDVDPIIERDCNEDGIWSILNANCHDEELPSALLSVKFRVVPSKMLKVGKLVPASIAGKDIFEIHYFNHSLLLLLK
jgi:hypothetical protein